MSNADDRISKVRTATIKHMLPTPIVYGDWVMRHREFRSSASTRIQAFEALGTVLPEMALWPRSSPVQLPRFTWAPK